MRHSTCIFSDACVPSVSLGTAGSVAASEREARAPAALRPGLIEFCVFQVASHSLPSLLELASADVSGWVNDVGTPTDEPEHGKVLTCAAQPLALGRCTNSCSMLNHIPRSNDRHSTWASRSTGWGGGWESDCGELLRTYRINCNCVADLCCDCGQAASGARDAATHLHCSGLQTKFSRFRDSPPQLPLSACRRHTRFRFLTRRSSSLPIYDSARSDTWR